MSRRPHKVKDVFPKLSHIYRYLSPEIRAQRALIAGSLTALFLGVVFRLLEPWPLKIFLDAVLPLGANRAVPARFSGWDPANLLLAVAAAVVVITACRALADYISRVGFFNVGNRVIVKPILSEDV